MTTEPSEPGPRSAGTRRATTLTLTAAALSYLLLTGLDAKSTALLAGSLTVFSPTTVALDALLLLGFGYAAWALRRGPRAARTVGLLTAGAALWRGLDTLLDLATAASTGNLQYWRTGQLATTALLLLAALFAAAAVALLARRATNR